MEYYYTKADGTTGGPATADELRALVIAGMLNASSKVAAVGSQEWVSISTVIADVASLRGARPATTYPTASPSAPMPTAVATGPNPLAIWSLILSLLGLFCCFLIEIPAVICGHMALSRTRNVPGTGGHGMAMAGVIIGYIGLFGWIVYLFLMGGMAAMQSMMPNK
jgi:hypothetical protein